MKTKEAVKTTSRLLFNEFGVMNITLREVAKKLNKSYGNITYYYSTKEKVILALFQEMNEELMALQHVHQSENLLAYFLELPKASFDITIKYLFFSIDFIELKRNFPVFFEQANQLNEIRKVKWLQLLRALRDQGYLQKQLTDEDLNYIMLLSISVRMWYLQMNKIEDYNINAYTGTVNRLLLPYLSGKGLEVYETLK